MRAIHLIVTVGQFEAYNALCGEDLLDNFDWELSFDPAFDVEDQLVVFYVRES